MNHSHLSSTPESMVANQSSLNPANGSDDGCNHFPIHTASISPSPPSSPLPLATSATRRQGDCKKDQALQQVHLCTHIKTEASETAELSKEPAMFVQDFAMTKPSHEVNLADASTAMYDPHKRRSSGSISVASSASSGRSNSSSSNDSVHNSIDSTTYAKPELSYAAIITEAIQSNHNQLMTLSEIYCSIVERYPYFKSAPPGWKNSIRHNLSLHKSFARVARPSNIPGKGSFWKLATGGPEEIPKKTMLRSARSESDPGITLALGSRSASLGTVTAAGSGAGLFSHLSPNGKDEHHSIGGMHRVSASQSSIPHNNMFFYSPPLASYAPSAAANAMVTATAAAAARRRAHSIMPNTGSVYLSPMPSSLYSISDVNGSGELEGSANAAYPISSASTPGSGIETASQASSSTISYGGSSNMPLSSSSSSPNWLPMYHPITGQLMYSMSPTSSAYQSSSQSWDPLYAIHESSIRSHHHPQPLDLSATATMTEQRPAQVNEWLSMLPYRPPIGQTENGSLLSIVGTNSYGGGSGSNSNNNVTSPLHRHSITTSSQTSGAGHGLTNQNSSSYVASYQPFKVAAAATLPRRKSSLMMAMRGLNDENIVSDMSANMISATGYLTPEGSLSPQSSSMAIPHATIATLSGSGAGSIVPGGAPLAHHQSLLTPSSSPVHHHHHPPSVLSSQAYDSFRGATHCYGMSNAPSSSGMMLMVAPTEAQISSTPTFYGGYSVSSPAYPFQVTLSQNAAAKNTLIDPAHPSADLLYAQQQPQVGAFAMDYTYSLSSASLLEHELLNNIQAPTLIPPAMTQGQAQQVSTISAINLQAAQTQWQPGAVHRQATLSSSYNGDSTGTDALEFVIDDKPPSMEWIYM